MSGIDAENEQQTQSEEQPLPGDGESKRERPLTASVEKLRGELDHWLDVAWSQGERALDAFGLKPTSFFSPQIDVVEATEEVRVTVDLPGVDPQEVDITLAGNMLTLKGSRAETPCEGNEQMHVRQRATGSFTKSIPMPVPVDSDKVSAEAKEGVLTIRLTKSESAQPRQIPVNAR